MNAIDTLTKEWLQIALSKHSSMSEIDELSLKARLNRADQYKYFELLIAI
jgi:hypothetical protein